MPVPSKPYTFTNGTTIDAAKVNSDFDTLYTTLNASLDAENIASSTNDKLGLSTAATVRRGKSIIATTETRSSSTYGTLTTPDQVQNVVLPTDGLIAIAYQANWKGGSAGPGRAAIFLGATQAKIQQIAGGSVSPVTQAGAMDATNDGSEVTLSSCATGLVSCEAAGGGSAGADVTTGQIVGQVYGQGSSIAAMEVGGTRIQVEPSLAGGVFYMFAAAGTYTVSVQFKTTGAELLTVKNRKLWVWTLGF